MIILSIGPAIHYLEEKIRIKFDKNVIGPAIPFVLEG
jgi:hypothetical protein